MAGLSVDAGFQSLLAGRHDLVIEKLFPRLRDPSLPVQHDTWRALVNLAQAPEIACLFGEEQVCAIAGYICQSANLPIPNQDQEKFLFPKESLVFADLACMLICNLSKCCGVPAMLMPFLDAFLELALARDQPDKYKFIFSVLADMTVVEECRRRLTPSGKFFKLLPLLQDEASVVRRGGACVVMKNCLLEVNCHEDILAGYDDALLATILGRLVNPQCQFTPEELDSMLMEISLEHASTPSESDPSIRAMLVESLVVLGTSLRGRELMRERNVYPVIREAHRLESEEDIKALMEQVVEYLLRDEDSLEPATKKRSI